MEQLKKERDFNPRPKTLISKNSIVKRTIVYVNLFPVTISKSITTFYCYSVRFEPDIEADFIFKKREVFHSIEKKIGQESNLGNFVYTGDNIYSDKEQKDLKIYDAFHSKTQCKYKVFISLTTEKINLTENNCFRTPAVKTITEEIVKKILRANVDLEFYRNLFVKTKEKQEIQSYTHKVDFYPGYTTGIHYLTDGTHLCVSLKNKILGKENCLEKINTLKSNAEIREFFQGRSVKTNYKKNNKNYLINDVNFDINPGNKKFTHRGQEITMMDYYEKVKGCKISNKNQPLFEVLSRNQETGKEDVIHIVPELAILSGLDDSMIEDRDFMQNLAQYTKMLPIDRIKITNKFIDLVESRVGKIVTIPVETIVRGENGEDVIQIVNREITLPSPYEIKNNFKLDFGKPKEFQADFMKLPTLSANNSEISLDKNNGTFKFMQQAEVVQHITDWICVYNKEDFKTAVSLLEIMTKAAKTFGITVKEPQWIETYSTNSKDWTKEVEGALKQTKPKIVVFLMSKKTKRNYKELKINSLVTHGYLSQCILRENLSDKKCVSVCSNLVKQINSKLGGSCYRVVLDRTLQEKNLMIVGVDSSHISGKRTGVAMCATIDKQFLKYTNYEQIIPEKTKNELCFAVANFIEKALKEYFKLNNKLPGGIVIYRQGVSAEQKLYLNDEVSQIEELLNGKKNQSIIKDFKIPYNYVLVNKKTNLKFFEKDGNRYSNSSPGLIIYDNAVNPKIHEFYIQPQFVNEGCATPTNYHIAYGDLDINEHIAPLTYALCYNYASWQGPIRVPAPLKNAEKLSKLVAKFIKAELNPLLNNTQCYL